MKKGHVGSEHLVARFLIHPFAPSMLYHGIRLFSCFVSIKALFEQRGFLLNPRNTKRDPLISRGQNFAGRKIPFKQSIVFH